MNFYPAKQTAAGSEKKDTASAVRRWNKRSFGEGQRETLSGVCLPIVKGRRNVNAPVENRGTGGNGVNEPQNVRLIAGRCRAAEGSKKVTVHVVGHRTGVDGISDGHVADQAPAIELKMGVKIGNGRRFEGEAQQCCGEQFFHGKLKGATLVPHPESLGIPRALFSNCRNLLLASFLYALFCVSGSCATIPAATTSKSDYDAAYALASDGDTIALPDGTSSWTTPFIISKAITLQGNGIGRTIIKDAVGNDYFGVINLTANKTNRITGIEFQDNGGLATPDRIRVFGVNNDNRRFYVDHCKFSQMAGAAFQMDTVYGVASYCTAIGGSGAAVIFAHFKGSSYGGNQGDALFGDGAWAALDQFGTDQFFYIEDCHITNSVRAAAFDGQAGARYIERFSTNYNVTLETHGSEAERERSGRAFEFYGNYLAGNGVHSTPIYMRGGVTLCFSNVFTNWAGSSTVLALVDNRGTENLFAPFGGSDGRNPWDKNNAGNPFVTGTASSGGTSTVTDSGKSWTVNQWVDYKVRRTSGKSVSSLTRSGSTVTATVTGHGYSSGNWISIWGALPYAYCGTWVVTVLDANTFTYTIDFTPSSPATGTILCAAGNNFGSITANTATQLTFRDSIFEPSFPARLVLQAGDTYEINKVDTAMDQPGVCCGSDLGGVGMPTLPGAWNNQTVSPCYQWANISVGAPSISWSVGSGGGGTFGNIVIGTHAINDTAKPGYAPYTYPHPLVDDNTNAPSLTPSSLNFGTMLVNTTSNKTITVSNPGTNTLTGVATGAGEFSVTSGGSYSLAPGNSQSVTVHYAPTSAATHTQTVTFTGGLGASAGVTGVATNAPVGQVNANSVNLGRLVTP